MNIFSHTCDFQFLCIILFWHNGLYNFLGNCWPIISAWS